MFSTSPFSPTSSFVKDNKALVTPPLRLPGAETSANIVSLHSPAMPTAVERMARIAKCAWKDGKVRSPIQFKYKVIGLFMWLCVVFIMITTFTPEPLGLVSSDCECSGIDRCICPRETVEALTFFQMFCLANSRVAAYSLYPLYLILYLSMCRNLKAWLQHTFFSECVPFTTSHCLHEWSGTLVGVVIFWHGLWHLIRWGVQGNMRLLIETQTGITGLISLSITPLLVLPMKLRYLREKISFEIRKRLHYMSWIWGTCLVFHAPQQHIFWIVGTAFLIYLIDWLYGMCLATRLAPSARFVRLESAVMIRVPKPDGFEWKGAGGYCYICVPWVSKLEWHAFSVFMDPFHDDYVCFCVAVAGDWTQKLYDEIREPVYRRLWIYGPFPSPFESARENDNVISVASGIGITPALAVIKSLEDHRKMHLIWMVRDASLLEFMIDYGITFDEDSYTLIFYSGKRELAFQRSLPYNIFILKGRPDLDEVIVSLIHSTKTRQQLDLSKYEPVPVVHVTYEEGSSSIEQHFHLEISRLLLSYSVEELFNAAVRRSRLNTRKVCFDGLRELIDDIFAHKCSDDQLRVLFDMADSDQSGGIDLAEFKAFIASLNQSATRVQEFNENFTEQGWNGKSSLIAPLADENKRIRVAEPDEWRLMYCGGSAQVVEILQRVASQNSIPFSVESFQW